MADDQVNLLFGSDSEDEAPAARETQTGGDEPPQAQPSAPATAADLFGSSDEDDEGAGAGHKVTRVLGEDDDDQYPADRSASRSRCCSLLLCAFCERIAFEV